MKKYYFLILLPFFLTSHLNAQDNGITVLDRLLLRGSYRNLLDTCRMILREDSLNPDIYFKMAIACQNLMNDDQALRYFDIAVKLDSVQKNYRFALAKALYGAGKYQAAEPLFSRLSGEDSLNWSYGYYLSSVYLLKEKYSDALRIYRRFRENDPSNYVFYDKIAFAYLKNSEPDTAIAWYQKSLSLNPHNLTAIKNLAWLYSSLNQADTAISLLTGGLEIDSTDLDLYLRRAQVSFSKNYTKRAMDDYLVLLAAGDTTELYLKRVGIGYCYNRQPKEAIPYLLLAHHMDSTDYETCNYLGQCYYLTKDIPASIVYLDKALASLSAVNPKIALTQTLLGDSWKEEKKYRKAIDAYLKAYALNNDPNLNMVIANIYDEKLNDRERAIHYYQRYLDTEKYARLKIPPSYIQSVRDRLIYLKQQPPKSK